MCCCIVYWCGEYQFKLQTVNKTEREVIGVHYSNYSDTDILSCSLNNSTQTGPSFLGVLLTQTHTILRVVRLGPKDKAVLCAAVLTKESGLTPQALGTTAYPSYTQICWCTHMHTPLPITYINADIGVASFKQWVISYFKY